MENVIVTTLKEKLQELRKVIHSDNKKVTDTTVTKFENLLTSINHIFTGWTVAINDSNLEIKRIIDGYHRTAIEFRWIYTHNKNFEKVYTEKVSLSWSSRTATEEYELHSGIMIGIICQLQLSENFQWKQLVALFKEYHTTLHTLYNDHHKAIYDKIEIIEKQIREIETNEKNTKLNSIFELGSMELTEKVRHRYGNAKHDNIYTDNFKWEIKPGQKTGKLIIIHNDRPLTIKERMPIEDIKSLISSYMNSKKFKIG